MKDFENFEDFGDMAKTLKNVDRSQAMDKIMETIDLDVDNEEDDNKSGEILQMLHTRMSVEAAIKQEQWVTAETLLEKLIRQCDALPIFGALSWMMKAYLASVKAILGKNREAMPLYLAVMALGSDPKLQERLRVEMGQLESVNELFRPFKSLWDEGIDRAVVSAYVGFVVLTIMECEMGEISEEFSEMLQSTIEDGLHFLETIGHPEWGYPFYLTHSLLLVYVNRLQESLDEAVVALSQRQKDTSFLSDTGLNHLTMYLATVGYVMCLLQRYEEAIFYLEQVVNSDDAPMFCLHMAYSGLSLAYSAQGKSELASEMENEAHEVEQREEIQATIMAATAKSLLKLEDK